MKKKFRLVSVIVGAAMLAVTVFSTVLMTGAATSDVVTSVSTSAFNGSYRNTAIVLQKELKATDSAGVLATYGDFVTVNGIPITDAYPYNGGAGNSIFFEYVDPTTLKFYTDNCSWAGNVPGHADAGAVVLGIHDNATAVVKLLEGFPFKDNTTLDRTITLTREANQPDWIIADPGSKPVEPTYPATELADVTVSGKQNNERIPAEANGNKNWYHATELTFNKELPTTDKAELLRLFGDKLMINTVPLSIANKYVNEGGGGTPAVLLEASADKKTLIVYTDQWSWVGNIMSNSSNLTIGTRPAQDNKIELLKGFQLKDGVLAQDIKLVLNANSEKWNIDDPNAEPDLEGVKVLVSMTNGEGGPGITDAVSGQTWQSIVKIVFDQPLTVADTSEDAIVEKFGPHIIINSKTIAELYKTKNPQTGVPHAVTMTLSADRKILTVLCDVSMPGVLTPAHEQFVLLSKDFPITSKKTLEREVAFEYAPEKGDWVALDPYVEGGNTPEENPGNEGSGNTDNTDTNQPTDDNLNDGPVATGVPFAGIAIVLVVLATGVLGWNFKKRKA